MSTVIEQPEVGALERRAWTGAEDAELRQLVAAGRGCVEIAERLGRSLSAVVNRRQRIGAKKWRKPRDRRERIGAALALNPELTDTELGRLAGCSRMTAARHRAALGAPVLSRSERAAAGARTLRAARGKRANEPTPSERRVLEALAGGPLTIAGIAARTGVGYNPVHHLLLRLRAKGHAFAEGAGGRGGTQWYALNWWLERNRGLVWSAAHRVRGRNRHADTDDLASVAILAVAKCVRAFRPRGVKFSTYALRVAGYDATAWALAEGRRGVRVSSARAFDAKVGPRIGSLEAMSGEGREAFAVADRGADAPPMDPDFWTRAVSGLPDRLAELVLAVYRDQRQQAEVAREWGVSRARVEQLLRGAERRIREGRALEEYDPRP